MAAKTLSIYAGTGNGGTLMGSSTATTITTLGGFSAVTWTFAGGLSLIDKDTYTAALDNVPSTLGATMKVSSSNPYSNGNLTTDTTSFSTYDAVFQGNFSAAATPVPFEFETGSGLAILGGAWLLRRHLQKKKATKV